MDHKSKPNMYSLELLLPQDCIISEKSLATVGATFNAKVITGNATAPPPSDVIPKNLILLKHLL